MHVQIASKHKLVNMGTTQLRCIQPAEYLRSRGISVTVSQLYKSIPLTGDILLLHRVKLDTFTAKYIEYARSLGLIVVYDTDDLIFSKNCVDYLKRINRPWYASIIETNPYREAMSLCDVVLVSVPYLALQAQQHADVRVMRNALSVQYLEGADRVYKKRLEETGREGVTIAYLSGSSTHDYDFKLVEPALLALLSKHSCVNVLVVGPLHYSREFLTYTGRFTHLEWVAYSDLPKLFDDIDINLVPLEIDQPFCQSKSELKYIEAGACGVPSVMSPTDVFLELIENKSNGILVEYDNWLEALEHLIENPAQRIAIGNAARNRILCKYSPAARAKEWEELMNDIFNRYAKSKHGMVGGAKKLALRVFLERMRCVREISALKGWVIENMSAMFNFRFNRRVRGRTKN